MSNVIFVHRAKIKAYRKASRFFYDTSAICFTEKNEHFYYNRINSFFYDMHVNLVGVEFQSIVVYGIFFMDVHKIFSPIFKHPCVHSRDLNDE